MNKKINIFFLFLTSFCFCQNDCADAIIVCGNTSFSGLSTNGFGTQEITFLNSCGSEEHNSIWIKLNIQSNGTLSFLLTPENRDIKVDFDFFIYGPNVNCSNIGQSIRCSTTNPEAANSSNNLTGLNSTEVDENEGPGTNGNNFVKSLNVLQNETYYLVIDRPIGESNFSLQWTGTTTFFEPPNFQYPPKDLYVCDDFNNGISFFNFNGNLINSIGNETNINGTFHVTYDDVITGLNPISNITNFQNTSNPQTIYLRLTNTITQCFSHNQFKLNVKPYFAKIESVTINDFSEINSVEVNTQNNENYLYNIDSQYGQFQESNFFNNVLIGKHIIYIKDKDGCGEDSKEIYVLGLPKFFTPNGDGYNDVWNIDNIIVEIYPNTEIEISDRYGKFIKKITQNAKSWDGTLNETKLLSDDYWYLLKLDNGRTSKGHFSLKR